MDRGAILDADRTIYKGERGFIILDGIDFLAKERVCGRTEADAVLELDRKYGSLKGTGLYSYHIFIDELVRTTASALEGVRQSDVRKALLTYMSKPELAYVFSSGLIQLFKERGYATVAISGSPTEMVQAFTEGLGVDETIGTLFEVDADGKYTGRALENCTVHDVKLKKTEEWLARNRLDPAACAGCGDSDQDAFLELVGYPVAIHPSPELEKKAKKNGWLICQDDEKLLALVADYIPRG